MQDDDFRQLIYNLLNDYSLRRSVVDRYIIFVMCEATS